MILAISKFKVANGLEAQVRQAFLARPRLVEQAPGFLGMQVFTDTGDPAIFYLLTKWTDAESFRHWHHSEAHYQSHQGIPKGLKLDPAFTQMLYLERVSPESLGLEEMISDSSQLLARFFTHASGSVFLAARLDGTIKFCNHALAELLNVVAEQLIGQKLWSFLAEQDAKRFKETLSEWKPAHERNQLVNFVDIKQVPYTLMCQLNWLPDGFVLAGESLGRENELFQEEMIHLNNELALITRENTRKSRELEKALAELSDAQSRLVHQEKMASLGRMTAGIAHEINNPIAFVHNNHMTLKRDFGDLLELVKLIGDSLNELEVSVPALSERFLEKAKRIDLKYLIDSIPRKISSNLEGLERVKQIVLDLRSFSRLDESQFKPVQLEKDILSTLRFLTPMVQEHKVSLETQFADLPPLLCCPAALNQAISNVVANAIQASPEGGRVTVSTFREGRQYVIEVVDCGIGIPPENLTKVFDPFFTTKPVGSGTGLGLSIAHSVIKAHHGEIQISSPPGKGTTVCMKLPFPSTGPGSGL